MPNTLVAARPPSTPRVAWLVAALVIAAVLLLYHETLFSMVSLWWRLDTFNHAFLVPPISGWLIWRQRERLMAVEPRPAWWILAPMLGMAVLWLLGELVQVNGATHFALVALLVLTVPMVLGLEFTRYIVFPLAFLFFCVPFGEFMMPSMMKWTADFTVAALHLSGIPVYREGLQFNIPSGSWSVVEACSGIRYLMASMMVGTLFAYLNFRSNRRRWLFVGVSMVTPILANWVRAYLIVMLGHVSGNTLAVGADHLVYGWVFFGLIMMLMFWAGNRWAAVEDHESWPEPAAPQAAATQAPGSTRTLLLAAAASAAVIVLPHLVMIEIERGESNAAPTLALSPPPPGWTPLAEEARFTANFVNPRVQVSQEFERGTQRVGVYVAFYRQQDAQSKLVTSENQLVGSKDEHWHAVAHNRMTVKFGGSEDADVKATTLRAPASQNLSNGKVLRTWRLYWIEGRWITDDVRAKIVGAMYRLAGRGDDGAAIVLYAIGDDTATLDNDLRAFAESNGDWLAQHLQATSARR